MEKINIVKTGWSAEETGFPALYYHLSSASGKLWISHIKLVNIRHSWPGVAQYWDIYARANTFGEYRSVFWYGGYHSKIRPCQGLWPRPVPLLTMTTLATGVDTRSPSAHTNQTYALGPVPPWLKRTASILFSSCHPIPNSSPEGFSRNLPRLTDTPQRDKSALTQDTTRHVCNRATNQTVLRSTATCYGCRPTSTEVSPASQSQLARPAHNHPLP